MRNLREDHALRLASWAARSRSGTPQQDSYETDPADAAPHVQPIASAIEEYLAAVAATFPFRRVEDLLSRLTQRPTTQTGRTSEDDEPEDLEEELLDELDEILEAWPENPEALASAILIAAIGAALLDGFRLAFNTWLERFRLKHELGPEIADRIRDLADAQADDLQQRIHGVIRSDIARILQAGLRQGKTIEQILAEISGCFPELRERGEEWAFTEALEALNRSALEMNTLLGAVDKEWVTRRDARVCASCLANESQGRIPIASRFATGHLHPPAHPWCRCSLRCFGVTRESISRAIARMLKEGQ